MTITPRRLIVPLEQVIENKIALVSKNRVLFLIIKVISE
jgi:hypothetical protein